MAIEPLAARLGATKGSGYWHFANRAALVEATLERWEREHTELVIAHVDQHGDPIERLRTLLHAVIGHTGPQTVELALLASADDQVVAPILR
ncbi:MAG: TetR/AcrR family transcriptional regulator, partial [Acidimicrobiales bacterium]